MNNFKNLLKSNILIATVFALFFILPVTLYATSKIFGLVKVPEVVSIYDADTFRANIEGWPPIFGERVSIRGNGIDEPEIRVNGKLKKTWQGQLNKKRLVCCVVLRLLNYII